MKSRRDFLRKTAIGSAVISSCGGLTVLSTKSFANNVVGKQEIVIDSEVKSPASSNWNIILDDASSLLTMSNGAISLHGQINFVSGANKWAIAKSRDGVPGRYALVDTKGNVQGYFVFNQNGNQLQLLFYHRTAQAFKGALSFEGKLTFLNDSFACRTKAKAGERVLALSCGATDSQLNDSLFAPESDTILQLDSANLSLKNVGNGEYSFIMSGQISESSEDVFTINVEADYFSNRYVPYYHAINRERCPKTPTGWMSWNTYFDKATAKDNLAEAKIGQKYLQPFGCEFWSIESWQGNSDQLPVSDFYNMNLEVNEKQFPEGMKKLADDIHGLGFRPGLWMAPFGTGNKEFYRT